MNIGFDAKRVFNNFTGLGNYSRYIVQALAENFPANTYYLYTPRVRQNAEVDVLLSRENISVVTPPPWANAIKAGSIWRSYFLGSETRKNQVSLFHGLSNELPNDIGNTKSVVTIHDLIFLRYPEFYKKIDVAIYKKKVKHAVKAASRIVAISKHTATDIVELLGVDPSQIDVVYQGCHRNFNRPVTTLERAEVKARYNLPDEFILNVGTIEPRKNALLILRALQQLKAYEHIPLVIIGRPTKYLLELKSFALRHKLQNRIIYLHDVSFVHLPVLYKLASVFVYPSLYEGFGIPLIEAISCGVPVITSTGSCFREAAGPSSIYVDPGNPEELAAQLGKVLSDTALVKKMTQESFSYIKQFEPAQIATSMMKVYSDVINNRL